MTLIPNVIKFLDPAEAASLPKKPISISAMGHCFGPDLRCERQYWLSTQKVETDKMIGLTKAEQARKKADPTVKIPRRHRISINDRNKYEGPACGRSLSQHQSDPFPCPHDRAMGPLQTLAFVPWTEEKARLLVVQQEKDRKRNEKEKEARQNG